MTKRPNDSRPKCEALELREAPASVASTTNYRPLDFQISGTAQTSDTHPYSPAIGTSTDNFTGTFRATGRITYDANGGQSGSVAYSAQGGGTLDYLPTGATSPNDTVSVDYTATETGTLTFRDNNGVWTTTAPFSRTSNRAVGEAAPKFERVVLGPSGMKLNFDPSTMSVTGGWAAQNGANATNGSFAGNVTQPGAAATDLSVSGMKLYQTSAGYEAKFDVSASGALMTPPDKTSPGAIAKVMWTDGTGRTEDAGVTVNVAWNAGKVAADVTGLEAPAWATGVKVVVEANGWVESATKSNNAGAADLGSAVNPNAPPPPPGPDPSARTVTLGGNGGPGMVNVYGPQNGLKFTLSPYGADWRGGISAAVGDVTGDGVVDIITGAGAGGGPHIKIFDGVTGGEIASFFAFDGNFRGGVNVAVADVDGDGRAEIIAGAGRGGSAHVKIFDGMTRDLRRSFLAFGADRRTGVYVAAADLNKDGKAEIITGSGAGEVSEVRVFGDDDTKPQADFLPYGVYRTGAIVGSMKLADGRIVILTGAESGYGLPVKKFDITGKEIT